MRRLLALSLVALGCGQQSADYAPAGLVAVGLDHSRTYVARELLSPSGQPLLVAHPRLGHAAIRVAGEGFEVSWIAVTPHPAAATATIAATGDSAANPIALPLSSIACDTDGVCAAAAFAPALAPGRYTLCITVDGNRDCSDTALAIVASYPDTPLVAHVSDVHAGDGDSATIFGRVVDALDALRPAPDLVVVSGDCADTGQEAQRQAFLAQLARLTLPSLVVTGNHDFDQRGIDGFLLDVNPELDVASPIGGLRVLGVASGQDLDDGNHAGTWSESDGPDDTQLAWLGARLDEGQPSLVTLHHPLYNSLFGTVGPQRDRLLDLLDRPSLVAVLAGHVHYPAVFDGDGVSADLDPRGGDLSFERWPLHFTAGRSSNGGGGYGLITVGVDQLSYRWVELASP